MRGLALILAGLPALCPFVLTGCESSQAKSKRLAKQGIKSLNEKGLRVRHANPDVKAVKTALLSSKEGAAAVVVLRNSSDSGQKRVPVSIDVMGAGGKSVFKNDAAGLEPSLVSAPIVRAGSDFVWVNDQVFPRARPRSMRVKVGPGEPLTERLPRVELSQPKLSVDPVSGVEASGVAVNRAQIEQRHLVIFCVAHKGGRIVAAGRGQIERLKVGPKKVPYHVFFIGDPRGAQLSVEAPPTVLH